MQPLQLRVCPQERRHPDSPRLGPPPRTAPSGANVNFANTKKHYSIGVNVGSEVSAYVATSSNSTATPPTSSALPRVMTLIFYMSGWATSLWATMARINAALGINMLSNYSRMCHNPKSCEHAC